MKTNLTLAILCAMLLAVVAPTAIATEFIEPSTKRPFPTMAEVNYDGISHNLTLSGATVRKKLWFKAYAIAHYMQVSSPFESHEAALDAALNGEGARRIVLDFVRDLSTEKLRGAMEDAFNNNTSDEEMAAIKDEVTLFLTNSSAVSKGDTIELTWFPDGTITTVQAGNKMPSVQNNAFAKVLWSIWLGENSIVDRNRLVDEVILNEDEDA